MHISYSAWIRSGRLSIHLDTLEYPETVGLGDVRWIAFVVRTPNQGGEGSEVLASIDSKVGYASHEEALAAGVNHFR